MADNEVWVQLYVGEAKCGRVFSIDIENLVGKKRIQELTEAVYEKCDDELTHCKAWKLFVYKAGTDVPPKEEDKLDPGDAVSTHTTKNSSKHPLRVVAPAILNQQPGKNYSCVGCVTPLNLQMYGSVSSS
jgi:hypothetical protein